MQLQDPPTSGELVESRRKYLVISTQNASEVEVIRCEIVAELTKLYQEKNKDGT